MKSFKQFITEVIQNDVKSASDIKNTEAGTNVKDHEWLKGKKISSFGNSDVYHHKQDGEHHYFAADKKTGVIHKQLSMSKNRAGTHTISSLAGTEHEDKTHHLYHHLITKHNITIAAGLKKKGDKYHGSQSRGAIKVWQKLHQMPGVNVHAFHSKTGKGEHIHDSDEIGLGSTHTHHKNTSRKNSKTRNLILVAHKKD